MLKRVLALVMVLAISVVVASGFVWWRSTRMPAWLIERMAAEPEPAPPAPGGLAGTLGGLFGVDMTRASNTLWVVQELINDGSVELDAERVTDITTTALTATRNGRVLMEAAGRLHARIDSGRITMGAVLNLEKIDPDALDQDLGTVLRRVHRWAPFLRGRPLFVGIEGTPRAHDGDLAFGEDTDIQVGRFAVPRVLARWLGMDRRLREELTVDLRVLELTAVTGVEDRLVLEAGPSLPAR